MDAIIELCDLVSPMKLRHLKLLEDDSDQAGQLYQLIKNQKIKDDDNAIDFFFSENKHAKTYLKGIKEKLFYRLVNTLLFLDQKEETDYKRAFFAAHRLYMAFKILSRYGKKKASLEAAIKGVKISQKYHFTELTLSFCRELKVTYSTLIINKSKFEKYAALLQKTFSQLEIEIEAEDMIATISMLTSKKQYNAKELKMVEILGHRAREIVDLANDFWTLYLAGNVLVVKHQMFKDHPKVTEACQLMISKLEKLPYTVPVASVFGFTFKMIPGHIINKEFTQGKKVLEDCLKMMQPGRINWIKAMQLKALLHFHSKNYPKAAQVAELINNDYPKVIKDNENWEIIDAYAKILTGKKLRLQRLLNEVPVYSKDKRGMNINILIIRVLEYIRRGDFGKVIDNTAALNQYAYRYLRQDDTYRSNCFTRMLLSLEKGHFNRIGVTRHASEFLEKLDKMPIEKSKQDYEVEIVPYEDLWNFLLNLLPEKA